MRIAEVDNESTYCNVNSDKNPEEQSLIYDIRRIQQLLKEKDLRKVHLVESKDQISDVITKEIKSPDNFNVAVYEGFLQPKCRCCYSNIKHIPATGIVELEGGYETGPGSPFRDGEENNYDDCF